MSMTESIQKAAISVTEVASLCRLSPSRFHALVRKGVFPRPIQPGQGSRSYYNHELAQKCLEIRNTGIGQDGRIVLFNRPAKSKPERKRLTTKPAAADHADLIEALRSLGMATTGEAVTGAVHALYPGGVGTADQGEVIRRVFLHLQGRKT